MVDGAGLIDAEIKAVEGVPAGGNGVGGSEVGSTVIRIGGVHFARLPGGLGLGANHRGAPPGGRRGGGGGLEQAQGEEGGGPGLRETGENRAAAFFRGVSGGGLHPLDPGEAATRPPRTDSS